MFRIFEKKRSPIVDFSVLSTDLHAHWLPGIDDGAPDIEQTVALVKALYDLGYRRLIATPHVISDLYPNTKADILAALEKAKTAVAEAGIDITLSAAAEYYMDEHFNSLISEDHEILPLPGNRVLVEMSFVSPPPGLFHYIFRLQAKGYQPVIAHPERYLFFKKDFKQYQRLKEHRCEFQLNLLSLIGYYGAPIQETAFKLLKNNMVDFLGTDMHHQRHAELLGASLADRKVQEVLGSYSFLNREI